MDQSPRIQQEERKEEDEQEDHFGHNMLQQLKENNKRKRKSTTTLKKIPPQSSLSSLPRDNKNTNKSKEQKQQSTSGRKSETFQLNKEQQEVYDLAFEGHNLFVTGGAGTGKSHLLMAIVDGLTEKYKQQQKEEKKNESKRQKNTIQLTDRRGSGYIGNTLSDRTSRLPSRNVTTSSSSSSLQTRSQSINKISTPSHSLLNSTRGGGSMLSAIMHRNQQKQQQPKKSTTTRKKKQSNVVSVSNHNNNAKNNNNNNNTLQRGASATNATTRQSNTKGKNKKEKREMKSVEVVAPTGCAATLVNGQTLFSLLGMGLLDKGSVSHWIEKAREKTQSDTYLCKLWARLRTLVIDEASMVSADVFTKMDHIMRTFRNASHLPFGGIQLIVMGDFYQLGPVTKNNEQEVFCFETSSWRDAQMINCHLETIVRQKQHTEKDRNFVEILSRIREGSITMNDIDFFDRNCLHRKFYDGIVPTFICCRNENVDGRNIEALNSLQGRIHTFEGKKQWVYRDKVTTNETYQHDESNNPQRNRVTPNNGPGNRYIDYKVNSFNTRRGGMLDHTLSRNNRQFAEKSKYTHNDHHHQNPPKVEKNTSTPQQQQPYVSMEEQEQLWHMCEQLERNVLVESTVRLKINAQVMLLRNINTKQGLVNGSRGVVVGFSSEEPHYPIVDFQEHKNVLIESHTWSRMTESRNRATYSQIPLKLAWAITIHKCQGITLDRASISLQNSFAPGQVYVALSRVRNINSLSLTNPFDCRHIRINSKVKYFYESNCVYSATGFEKYMRRNWEQQFKETLKSNNNTTTTTADDGDEDEEQNDMHENGMMDKQYLYRPDDRGTQKTTSMAKKRNASKQSVTGTHYPKRPKITMIEYGIDPNHPTDDPLSVDNTSSGMDQQDESITLGKNQNNNFNTTEQNTIGIQNDNMIPGDDRVQQPLASKREPINNSGPEIPPDEAHSFLSQLANLGSARSIN